MMLPEFESKEWKEFLIEITNKSKPRRHKYYDETVEHMKAMGVHVTGDNPKKLLDIKRPNESEPAKVYRLASYKPKTKAASSKVISVINRIYNDRLYSIIYPESPVQTIDKEDGLQEYLTSEMPNYTSLMNYIKSVFTKLHLKDPNGVIAVEPKDYMIEDTDYFDPIPNFYMSDQVLDFVDGHYYILGYWKKEASQNVLYKIKVFDKNAVTYFEKTVDKWNLSFQYVHNFDELPAFRVGGIVKDSEEPILYESNISGVLPHWDEAVCMASDLQAAIVNHTYPEKWEFTIDCMNPGCMGGMIKTKDANQNDIEVKCSSCHGTGKVTTKSPYDIYQINRKAFDQGDQIPAPPMGYVEKETKTTELLESFVQKEIDNGFEAVSMDIIKRVGENQSGVAKMYDRQDLDGFLSIYSAHVFSVVIPNIIYAIELWRYSALLGTEDNFEAYFPIIKPPTTFDVYSINLLSQEYGQLREAGVTGAFLQGVQKDMIEKRFDEETQALLKTIIDVDPLGALTADEILASSSVIGRVELYIHTYAKALVEQAIDENESFLSLPDKEKKEKIRQLAESNQPKVIEVEPAG